MGALLSIPMALSMHKLRTWPTWLLTLNQNMQQLHQQQINTNAQIAALNQNMQQMHQQQMNTEAQVAALRQEMHARHDMLTNGLRRSVNKNAFILAQGAFFQFPNAQNVIPAEFPEDYTAFTGRTP